VVERTKKRLTTDQTLVEYFDRTEVTVVDLDQLLKPHAKAIRQKHLAGDRLVVNVRDEETKSAIETLLAKKAPKVKAFVTVASATVRQDEVTLSDGDRIEVVYSGALQIAVMKPTGFGKKHNPQFAERFTEVFKKSQAYEPVILSADMTVIDGEQRIASALELGLSTLPAVVLNTTELQAKFLRLVLNKSNEFQRWHWEEVDGLIEEHPDLLKQLEPLAIFGERVVPESFFGNTVIGYEIHAETLGKTQQSYYKQEHGLAKWAKLKRDQLEAEAANSRSGKKAAAEARSQSIFDVFGGEAE